MRTRRLPMVFLLYGALTILQPAVLVWVGAIEHVQPRGLWFMALLLVGLARGSRIAWGLLVVIDAVPLLALGALGGGQVLWGHVTAMILTGLALELTLFSPAMRRHVRRPDRRPGRTVPSP